MFMRTVFVWLAMPLLLSGSAPRYGVVHSSADPRAHAGVRPTKLLASAAAQAAAPPAAPSPRRKPGSKRSAPRTSPWPQAQPTGGHTTIAPFPVPGDTSRAAAERMKTMNLPKEGITTIAPLPPPSAAPGMLVDPRLPGYVPPDRVDVLPEATLRVPPSYPDAAREAGIQGQVFVQAHVRRDGTVDSVRVIRSVPGLDSAAMECVKQWRFKPASYQGEPIPVWVGVPIRFTLH